MENKTVNTYEQQAQRIFNALSDAQKNYMFELYEAKTEAATEEDRDYYANKLYAVMNFIEAGHDDNSQRWNAADFLDSILWDYLINRYNEAQEPCAATSWDQLNNLDEEAQDD